jgi:hypothetical protein
MISTEYPNRDNLEKILQKMVSCPHVRARVVSYAVENSLSVTRKDAHQDHNRQDLMRSFFDLFVRLAVAFENIPSGHYRVSGDGLWISKDIVFSLKIIAEHFPDTVEEFKKNTKQNVKYRCGEETVSLLRECNFAGELLRYIGNSELFKNKNPFRDGVYFFGRLLQYARSVSRPLQTFEMWYDLIRKVSWNMDPEEKSDPWSRAWKRTHTPFHGSVNFLFRGQEKTASEHCKDFRHILSTAHLGEQWTLTPAQLRALWIASAGAPNLFRKTLLERTWLRTLSWTDFSSCLVPWMCPTFATALSRDQKISSRVPDERLSSVTDFIRVAMVLDALPEAHELCFDAWFQEKKTMLAMTDRFPHLRHVVEKVLRFRDVIDPPVRLCEDILRCSQKRGDAMRKFSREKINRWKQTETLDAMLMDLRRDGCDEYASGMQKQAKTDEAHRIWFFEAGRYITWVDIVATKNRVWNSFHTPIIARTRMRYYVMWKDEEPQFFQHPLSKLLAQNVDHPLASESPDLLALCV